MLLLLLLLLLLLRLLLLLMQFVAAIATGVVALVAGVVCSPSSSSSYCRVLLVTHANRHAVAVAAVVILSWLLYVVAAVHSRLLEWSYHGAFNRKSGNFNDDFNTSVSAIRITGAGETNI